MVSVHAGYRPRRPGQGQGRKISGAASRLQGGDAQWLFRCTFQDLPWVFIRASIAKGLDAAAQNVKDNLRIYPLSKKANPPMMEFIGASGKSFNTIHANDYSFYEHLHHIVDREYIGMLAPETRGLFASIGIEKSKPFAPDARMKRILEDAIKIANAAARSIVWYPRTDGAMKGVRVYPDTDSAWIMA